MSDDCGRGHDGLFDVQKVGDGIWVAVAARQFKVNCNTVIIETDDGLLVVDSHSKPSAARVILECLRDLTPKPVRYVVNTPTSTGTTGRATRCTRRPTATSR